MTKFLLKHIWLILLLLTALLLVNSLFKSGWYSAHDGIFHIYRTEEALSMLKLGSFPLRWAGNFDQGFGIPLFTFIYPLPYYITSALSILIGSIWAVKFMLIAAYLLGGFGIYFLFQSKSRILAFSLSLLYLMTPYQFLNIFVRGALGEVLAMGLMPWVILSYNSLFKNSATLKWYHPIPLGLLLISHNFLGILFSVFLFGYILVNKKFLRLSFISLFTSFGLAAFFIVPMISQKDLLYSTIHPDLNFRYDQHFVKFNQLLYGKWDYWYSMPPDQVDGMSFQLGFAQLIVATLGILYTLYSILYTHKTPKSSALQIYLIFAYLGSIFLMHAKSNFIWEFFPILKSIQFPWRFLFMPALLTPILAYPLLYSLRSRKLFTLILMGTIALSFINVRNYRRPMKALDLTEYTDLYRLYFNKTSTTFRSEILPKWNVEHERFKTDELLINSGNMTLDKLSSDPLSINFELNNKPDPSVARASLLRNYYPGWVLLMDQKEKIEIAPTSEGFITFTPPLGTHSYELKIKNTTIELVSNYISLISLLGLGYLWRKSN